MIFFSNNRAFVKLVVLNLSSSSEPGHRKMRLMPYTNNKGAGQPAHLRSLISTFAVRCLDSMIHILAISKASRL